MTPPPGEAEPAAPDPAGLFGRFDLSSRSSLVVAVSGGSDSTALLLLVREWRDRAAPHLRILAATVDHGLRRESAAEAASVATFCTGLGVEHLTLRWTGAKPATGLQAAAREARLGLLAGAAVRAGTDIVLVGHTADDQAETVAMRAGRGPGIGLAGMAPATLVDGRVWFVRPLLGMRRQALRAFLLASGTPWIDDPSNDNPAFERVRLRTAATRSGRTGVDRQAVHAAGRRRCDLAARAAALLDAHAASPSPGLARLDPAFFAAQDREAAVHAFRALLAAIGGGEHLPDLDRAAALFDRTRPPLRATLSRTVVDARRAGIFLLREQRGLPGPAEAADGAIWDGRFRLHVAGSRNLRVAPAPSTTEAAAAAAAETPASLVRAALAAEPVLLDHETPGTPPAPSTSATTVVRLVPPWSRFLPSFDLPLAQAVARILGAPPFPPPPFHGHKGAKA